MRLSVLLVGVTALLVIAVQISASAQSQQQVPQGHSDAPLSDEAVEDAQRQLDLTVRQFRAGLVFRSDVAQAEYNLTEMKYKAGQITRAEYCESAMKILKLMADLAQNQAMAGLGRLQEEIAAKRQYYETEARCSKKSER